MGVSHERGAVHTCHGYLYCTCHGYLAMLILQAGTKLSWKNVADYASRLIDVIVQLERDGGTRGVRKVWVTGE